MSCPTCDHTMEGLSCNDPHGRSYYVCPRCGTWKEVSGQSRPDGGFVTIRVPKLVSHCREFMNVAVSVSTPQTVAALHRLGVIESIYPPGRQIT